MTTVAMPKSADALLVYLQVTKLRSARSIDALMKVFPDDQNIVGALDWLIQNGFAEQDGVTLELTFDGQKLAEHLQTSRWAAPSPTPEPPRASMPTIQTHPLRSGTPTNPLDTGHQTLHFMLAFAAPKNALPTPVVDEDILGRAPDATIRLRQDDCLSSRHCRFYVAYQHDIPILCIEDLGSLNGTLVNNRRLMPGEPLELDHGDRIEVGSTTLIVVRIPY